MRIKNYITILLLLAANIVLARPQLHNLDIKVVLSRNGDARITETRLMSIDSEGTECYIGLANMGESEIRDLEVYDESGTKFLNVDWDIHEDRSWKTMKCGIVRTKSGYEICWGLGQSGERTYITTYTMTGLVRGYPDANAMRHVFLDEGVNPKPEHAKVTIMGADSTMVFDADSCNVWGFRFNGEVWFESGMVMAETTDGPMSSEAGLYVMVQFPLSQFEPHVMENVTFEEKKGEAFEGSDYVDNGDEEVDWDDPETFFGFIFVVGLFLWPIVAGIWSGISKWRARKLVNKDLMWYRDIPLKGDLHTSGAVRTTTT